LIARIEHQKIDYNNEMDKQRNEFSVQLVNAAKGSYGVDI
jgi:hypothetical protein